MKNVGRQFLYLVAALAMLCVGGWPSIFGQEKPELVAVASANEIFVGESINFQLDIRNADNPSPPDMSLIKELFEVVELGNQSRNQSQMTIINGRVSQQNIFSHIYQYRLTPKETGALVIPAATVSVDRKELSSNVLPLKVMPPEEQDVVRLDIESDATTVFPTQPFVVTLRVLVKPVPGPESSVNPLQFLRRNPPHFQINWLEPPDGLSTNETSEWLQPLVAQNNVGFTLNEVSARTGFLFDGQRAAVFDLKKGREIQNSLDGTPIEYFKYELTRTFTGEKPGSYSFGPAVVKGTFAVAGSASESYAAKRIVATTKPLSIEIKEIPSRRPATFAGGIGEYVWRASANPTKLRVGDPLTLILECERGPFCGSLDLISAPDLSAIPDFAARFELIDQNPTGRVEGSVKRFSYGLRPKLADVSIPAIPITSFDPSSEEFVETSTIPIAMDVSPSVGLNSGELIGSIPTTGSRDMKSRSEGIFQNVTDPTLVQDERIAWRWWGQVVGGVWLVAGSLAIWVTFNRRQSLDARGKRRQSAKRVALRKLEQARQVIQQGDKKEAVRLARSAILGLVADTRNLPLDGLTAKEVDDDLRATHISVDDRDSVSRLLESIEATEYGAGQSYDPSTVVQQAANLVARIAPILEKGKSI